MLQEFEIVDFHPPGFLGFFSGLVMTFTNRNTKLFCATTNILKGGFQPIKRDVNICFLKTSQILCSRLFKSLQQVYRHKYVSKRGNFKYRKLSRNTKNFAYDSMNFDFLTTR